MISTAAKILPAGGEKTEITASFEKELPEIEWAAIEKILADPAARKILFPMFAKTAIKQTLQREPVLLLRLGEAAQKLGVELSAESKEEIEKVRGAAEEREKIRNFVPRYRDDGRLENPEDGLTLAEAEAIYPLFLSLSPAELDSLVEGLKKELRPGESGTILSKAVRRVAQSGGEFVGFHRKNPRTGENETIDTISSNSLSPALALFLSAIVPGAEKLIRLGARKGTVSRSDLICFSDFKDFLKK